MQTTIDRQALREAVDKAALFIPTCNTLPQLESIQFSANGKLDLRATDLETSVHVTIPRDGEGIGDGIMNLPAELFQKALAGKDTGYVRLDYEQGLGRAKMYGSLTTKQGQSFRLEASFALDEGSKFPEPVSFPTDAPGFFIESDKLREIARKCVPFAATDALRPAHECILLAFEITNGTSGTLRAVAIDGHRMIKLRLPILAREEFSLLIAALAFEKATRAMGFTIGAPVQVQYTDTHVRFSRDGVEVIMLRLDETFPDYGKVIPRGITTVVTVERAKLEHALAPLAVCANHATNRLTFTVSASGEFVIEAGDTWEVVGSERVPCDIVHPGSGNPFPYSLDARLLRTALATLESDEIAFRFTGPLIPVLFEETTKTFESVLMLVCPQRPEPTDPTGGMRGTALAKQAEPEVSEKHERIDPLAAELAMAHTEPSIIAEMVEADDLAVENEIAALEAEMQEGGAF
jgi:DNA polymerase-3 subunit beta